MTQPSTPQHVALATLVLITMTAAACGHSSPVAPDAAAARTDAAASAPSASLAAKPGSGVSPSAVTFPLSAGTFTIAGRKGAQISGVYSGETSEVNGLSVTKLRMEVQNGTGALAGAAGVLDGAGRGAFTGEGAFSLAISGTLSASGKRTKFSASLEGWSNIGCVDGHVIITLLADRSHGAKSGGEMRHEVGNAGCGF
jgi:hypothetical protein